MLQAVSSNDETIVKSPIKKSDYFFYYLFWPVFKLPLSVTPNHVSCVRLFLCPPLFLLVLMHFFHTAAVLFLLAALMDGLDGTMARMRNQESSLGKILDPTADKALNMTVFISYVFYINSSTYKYLIAPIIIIDTMLFLVAISKYGIKDYLPKLSNNHWLRNWLEPQVILQSIKVDQTGANSWGKTKMVLQIIVLSAMMLFNPQVSYFIHQKIQIPFNLTILDLCLPLLVACIVFGSLSLWGHLKVVHFTK
jgi:phosphatidylglycerophosphate synthase